MEIIRVVFRSCFVKLFSREEEMKFSRQLLFRESTVHEATLIGEISCSFHLII